MEWLEEANQMLYDLFNAQARRGSEPAYIEYYPLHAAIERGDPYTFIQSLLDVRWPVEKYDWFCCTPLTYAVIKCLQHAVLSGDKKFVETTLINEKYKNWLEIVKVLRAAGAIPENMSLPISSVEMTSSESVCSEPLDHYNINELVEEVKVASDDIHNLQVKNKISELYTSLH